MDENKILEILQMYIQEEMSKMMVHMIGGM